MISRFVNLFKKNDLDEQRSFQRKVLDRLSQMYPDKEFRAGEDPLSLEKDRTVFGLTNLRANYLLSSQTTKDLDDLIKIQFDSIFTGVDPRRTEVEWESAQNRLMPQLMPVEFIGRTPLALVHRPVVEGVVLAYVLDSETTYSYVSTTDRDRWNVDEALISNVAFENLNERSKGIGINLFEGENAFLVIDSMDGFDAVRLMSSEIRETFAKYLGSPFFAGIPNRDFLICFKSNGNREFFDSMRSQISNDHDERPYPLCGSVLEVSADGSLAPAVVGEMDPRAKDSDLN